MELDSRQSLFWEEAVLPINHSICESEGTFQFILKNSLQMPLVIPLPSLAQKACWGATNIDLNFAGASQYNIASSNRLRCNNKQVRRCGTRVEWSTLSYPYYLVRHHQLIHVHMCSARWCNNSNEFLQNSKNSQVWILSVGQNSTNKQSARKVNVRRKKWSGPNFNGITGQSVSTAAAHVVCSQATWWDGDRVEYGNVRVVLWVMLCWTTLGPISALLVTKCTLTWKLCSLLQSKTASAMVWGARRLWAIDLMLRRLPDRTKRGKSSLKV